jgi:hypothetical protein
MKYSKVLLVVILILLVFFPTLARFGFGDPPMNGCPSDYKLDALSTHTVEHQHVQADMDINRDGEICVKPLEGGGQSHMDNIVYVFAPFGA